MTTARFEKLQIADPELISGREQRGIEALTSRSSVVLVRAADIKPEPIMWLWPGWLPLGRLAVLAGEPGTGKTTLALDLAAAFTSGRAFPGGAQSMVVGNVLIWSGEDCPRDTLVPRLAVAGADLSRCFFIDGMERAGKTDSFDPARDMSALLTACEEIGKVSLLIIDPIVSAVAGNMHHANDVRRGLQPVVDFARAHGCAVLGLTHFTKGGDGQSPLARVIGSQAFGALARVVMVAAKDQQNDLRVLARAKSNIAPDDGGFGYTIESIDIGDGIIASSVVWRGEICGTARDILSEVETSDVRGTSELENAKQFLRDLLVNGPVPVSQVKAEAEEAGYSWATVRRARDAIAVKPTKGGMKTGWFWQLTDGA